jgi:cyclophilin family peptidyl-prolyl cis-trans isomerase
VAQVRTSQRRTGALAVLGALLFAGCGQIPGAPSALTTPAGGISVGVPLSPAGLPSTGGDTCEYVPTGDAAKPVKAPPSTGVPTSGTVSYVLKMTAGNVTIKLDRNRAPCTVNSFVSLADQGFFDQTRCHRLSDSGIFVLQCGDPTGTASGGPGYQFANETDGTESYTSGVVAMANAGPDTNGSQFFLVWDDSTSLDSQPDYTIFGHLDKASRDVVAEMAGEGQDGSNPDGTGRPNNPSEIISAKPK